MKYFVAAVVLLSVSMIICNASPARGKPPPSSPGGERPPPPPPLPGSGKETIFRFRHVIVEIITDQNPKTTTTTPESHVMEKITPVSHDTEKITPVSHVTGRITPVSHVTGRITPVSHVTGRITPRAQRKEIALEADVIKRITGRITPMGHATRKITQKFHVARAITKADHVAKGRDQEDAAKEALIVIMMMKLMIILENLTANVTRIARGYRVTERTTRKDPGRRVGSHVVERGIQAVEEDTEEDVVEREIQVAEEDPKEDLTMTMIMRQTTPENLTEERITRRDLRMVIIQENHAALKSKTAMIGDQKAAATRVRGEGERPKS